jgi:beta-glucanase (GH16 family)
MELGASRAWAFAVIALASLGGCPFDRALDNCYEQGRCPKRAAGDGGATGGGGAFGGGGGSWRTGGGGSGGDCPEGTGLPASETPPIAGNWTLVFDDQFNDGFLDGRRWKMGGSWAGISGRAGNSEDNISVECGYLVMRAERRSIHFGTKNYAYATGEVSTFKRFRQRYGYIEARIRFDAVRGVWPSFWLLPDRGAYGTVDDNATSLLKFDFTNDSRPSVSRAVLQLHVQQAETAEPQNIAVHRVLDDSWNQSSVTWNTQPPVEGVWAEQLYNPRLAAGGTLNLDVTEVVNRELRGDRVISFALVDGFMQAQRLTFSSIEDPAPANRPRIVLTGGSPAEVVAVEDATVRAGVHAAENAGAQPTLEVYEDVDDTTSTYDGGMEIDIEQSFGVWGPNKVSRAAYWDGFETDEQSYDFGGAAFSFDPTPDDFHVHGLYWGPGVLRFYVDGKLSAEWSSPRIASVPEFVILSLQMGGGNGNDPPDDAALPARMKVDSVRVWSGTSP